jgi:hypothetical protein
MERLPLHSNARFDPSNDIHGSLEGLPWNAFSQFPEEPDRPMIPEIVSPSSSENGSEAWDLAGEDDEWAESSIDVVDFLPPGRAYEYLAATFALRPPGYEDRALTFLEHQLASDVIISFVKLTTSPYRNYLSPQEVSVEGLYKDAQGLQSHFILRYDTSKGLHAINVWPSDNEHLIIQAFKRFIRQTRKPEMWINDFSLSSGWHRLRHSMFWPVGRRRRASFPDPPFVSEAGESIIDSWQNDSLLQAKRRLGWWAGQGFG